jgi:hypothetical protein
MDYAKLTNNQKRVVNLLYHNKGEYWIQKQTSNNKQGFLWRLYYYDDDSSPYKINNWTVNALINKKWLEETIDTSIGVHGVYYAVLTEKANSIMALKPFGIKP